jgi:hypothetical protein
MAPVVLKLCNAFDAADAADRAAEASVNKEVKEGGQALDALKKEYEPIRELVALKNSSSYEASTRFNTPDDFLNAAEDMERELQASDPQWAEPVLAKFTPLVESAGKEYTEATTARKAQQKTALAREQAEGVLRPVLVRYRRAVRGTFGSSSREYRELLDRRSRGSVDDDGGSGPDPS